MQGSYQDPYGWLQTVSHAMFAVSQPVLCSEFHQFTDLGLWCSSCESIIASAWCATPQFALTSAHADPRTATWQGKSHFGSQAVSLRVITRQQFSELYCLCAWLGRQIGRSILCKPQKVRELCAIYQTDSGQCVGPETRNSVASACTYAPIMVTVICIQQSIVINKALA